MGVMKSLKKPCCEEDYEDSVLPLAIITFGTTISPPPEPLPQGEVLHQPMEGSFYLPGSRPAGIGAQYHRLEAQLHEFLFPQPTSCHF